MKDKFAPFKYMANYSPNPANEGVVMGQSNVKRRCYLCPSFKGRVSKQIWDTSKNMYATNIHKK